jgi:hypothetical protein
MIIGRIFKKRFWWGISFLLLSLLPLLYKKEEAWYLTLCFASFCIGITLVSDYIADKIGGKSLQYLLFVKFLSSRSVLD